MNYYVNTQPQDNGDHEVHKSTCMHLPDVSHRRYLGNFANRSRGAARGEEVLPQGRRLLLLLPQDSLALA